jgi:hypothetical protein
MDWASRVLWNNNCKGQEMFLFSEEFKSALGTNHPLVEWELGAFLKCITARA